AHPVITSPIVINNAVNGVLLDGGAIAADNGWDNPEIVYRLSNHVTVNAGVTLTLAAGQVVKVPNNVNLFVHGTMKAPGSAAKPIIFTSYRDDTAGGDTDNNGATTGASADWGGLVFESDSTANVMDFSEVRYGGYSNGTLPGQIIVSGALSMTNSMVRN